MSACSKARRWQVALVLFAKLACHGHLQAADQAPWNAAITSCARVSGWQLASHLLLAMRSQRCQPDAVSFGAALAALEAPLLWEKSLQVLGDLRSASVQPDLPVLASLMAASGHVLRSFPRDSVAQVRQVLAAVNVGVSGVGSAGLRWEHALELGFNSLRQVALRPDVVTCNTLISSLGAAACWADAVRVLSGMQVQRLQADAVTFGALVAAMGPDGCWRQGLSCLTQAEAAGLESVASLNAALSACVGVAEMWPTTLSLLL
ncbi:unnamed protein product, partial [Polarella glacialis]